MKIIALVGESNSGKTSTIKILADLLLSSKCGGTLVDITDKKRQRSCIDEVKMKSCGDTLASSYKGDITIKIKWNNQLIGITSFGDDVKSIKSKFEILSDCDVFVCGAHPFDATIAYINSIPSTTTICINKVKNAYDDSRVAETILKAM